MNQTRLGHYQIITYIQCSYFNGDITKPLFRVKAWIINFLAHIVMLITLNLGHQNYG